MSYTEDHLKAQLRQQGYVDMMIYTFPDSPTRFSDMDVYAIPFRSITSTDKLEGTDITAINDVFTWDSSAVITHGRNRETIRYETNTTVATLEENLWTLDGRFITLNEGDLFPGYISESVSDEQGEFDTNPIIRVNVDYEKMAYVDTCRPSLSIMLSPVVPSGYPKEIILRVYGPTSGETPDIGVLATYTKQLEWDEDSGEVDDDNNPIIVHKMLDTLPMVTFPEIQMRRAGSSSWLDVAQYMEIEFVGTHNGNRRIRVCAITCGTLIPITNSDITSVEYKETAPFVNDSLPTRTLKFELQNYNHLYDIDNPDNTAFQFGKNTIVLFRTGYNIYGYETDNQGNLIFDEQGYPIINNPYELEEIAWEPWRQIHLTKVSATSGEKAVFECTSVLDTLNTINRADFFWTSTFNDPQRYIECEKQVSEVFETDGYSTELVEWSSDGVKQPAYNGTGQLLPYEQWVDTNYSKYILQTVPPAVAGKEIMQCCALSVGATLLLKDNDYIKFANLDLSKPESFTNHHSWTYRDFAQIPEPTQLETLSSLDQLSLTTYKSTAHTRPEDYAEYNVKIWSGEDTDGYDNGYYYIDHDDAVITDVAYGNTGNYTLGRVVITKAGNKQTVVEVSNVNSTTTVDYIALNGFKITTQSYQESSTSQNGLVLDTKLMNSDINSYNSDGTVKDTNVIRRKYFEWYNKKFKYKLSTRGEPLAHAGDYCTIETQFSEEIPGYILSNRWTFDGAWTGEMEVIALDN